jgi:hypothetical protein
MGGGTWSDDTYKSIKQTYSTQTKSTIFSSIKLNANMSPVGITFRESRDSTEHPNSLAVFVGLDETGSMGTIPEFLIKHKLGELMNTIIAHGIPDAQILFAGLGDHYSDEAPLQVGQFESETTKLDGWLTKIWLEENGGGNGGESYPLAWRFAAHHTTTDCFEKRNQKGILFTIGDENYHPQIEANSLKKIFGYQEAVDQTAEEMLLEAQRTYEVFHIFITHGGVQRKTTAYDRWEKLLGEKLIVCDDHNIVAEIIASTVAVLHGASLANVVKGFDQTISAAVSKALVHVTNGIVKSETIGSSVFHL